MRGARKKILPLKTTEKGDLFHGNVFANETLISEKILIFKNAKISDFARFQRLHERTIFQTFWSIALLHQIK